MPLFQASVVTKHLNELNKAAVQAAYNKFKAHFGNAAQHIQASIDKTDKEIDAMVYQLYELTAEEIAIVEGVN